MAGMSLREARSQGLADTGILPSALRGLPMPTTPDWESLTPEQQAFEARGMAVYAGMVDAMDHHIGRLVDHIDSIGSWITRSLFSCRTMAPKARWQHGLWVTGQMRRLRRLQSGCAGLAITPTAIRWVSATVITTLACLGQRSCWAAGLVQIFCR